MSNQNEDSGPSELELLKTRARMIGVEFSNNIGLDTLRQRVNDKLSELDDEESEEIKPAEATPNESDESIPEVVDTALPENFNPDVTDPVEENTDPDFQPVDPFDEDIEEEEVAAQPNAFDAAAQVAQAKVTAPPSNEIKRIKPLRGTVVEPSPGGAKLGQPTKSQGKTPTLRQHLYNEQMKLVRLRIQNLDPKKADLNGEVIAISNKYLGTVKMFVPYGEVTDDGWHVPYIIYKELERRRFLSIRTVKDPRTRQPVVKKGWAKEFALDILEPLSEAELRQLATAQAAAGSIDNNSNDLL